MRFSIYAFGHFASVLASSSAFASQGPGAPFGGTATPFEQMIVGALLAVAIIGLFAAALVRLVRGRTY